MSAPKGKTMFKTFYLKTIRTNSKGKEIGRSTYRMTPVEAALSEWENETITDVKEAGTFKFSDIISHEGAKLLWMAVN